MAATTDTTGTPAAHPYAFADMQEARRALWTHVRNFDDTFRDAERLAGVVEALALANVEARLGDHEGMDQAFSYLSERLVQSLEEVRAWHARAHRLTVIVTDNDLDALRKYPVLEADAPPAA